MQDYRNLKVWQKAHELTLALYASSFNFEQINFNRLASYLLWGGVILILLAFFRWAAGAAEKFMVRFRVATPGGEAGRTS